jgi:hypothetical protein
VLLERIHMEVPAVVQAASHFHIRRKATQFTHETMGNSSGFRFSAAGARAIPLIRVSQVRHTPIIDLRFGSIVEGTKFLTNALIMPGISLLSLCTASG